MGKPSIDTNAEGLESLMGARITLFCMNYFYTGKLVGIGPYWFKLTEPSIVYETGSFTEKEWSDAQELPHDIYVMKMAIEAFGVVK